MYAFIQGTVEDIAQDRVSVNCGGVGYEILANQRTIGKCAVGKDTRFYTYLSVREDAMVLYGFLHKDEKEMFLRLISVSGIGPKVGLSILSTLTAQQAAIAIVSGDDKVLSKVPGIGKKTAQRLVLELKGTIENQALIGKIPETGPAGDEKQVTDAIAILTAMGFAPSDAAAAVALIQAEGGTAEEMAVAALRKLDRMK